MSSTAEMPDTTNGSGQTCYCFLNAAAGSDSAGGQHSRLTELFAALGSGIQIVTPEHGDVEAAVRRALTGGCKRIIAAGGDGTIHAVANVLAGTEAALGILPLGTLNHFARDLGVPLDVEQAVRTAIDGSVRSVDVGEVNGRLFVNNSSVGLYPRIVREREALQRKGDSKLHALIRATVGVFQRAKALRLRIRHDGQSLRSEADFVFVGNNEYQFDAGRIAARPRLDASVLWVWHVPHAGRFRAIAAAAAALFRRNPKSPLTFTTKELVLETRARQVLVALDGEAMEMNAPLTYRIRPNGLRVIVPRENSA